MATLDHKELQNELKTKQICRFCLSIDPISLTNISCHLRLTASATLPIQVMAIASIEIFTNDGMPPYACSDCISMFEYSYQFKQMCKKADSLLRQYPLIGKWPESLKKPTMPKTMLTKCLLEKNNITFQEDVQHTKQNVTQESLLLPKKTVNVDAEDKDKANDNVTNSKRCVPKVEKVDDECNITYLEKIDNCDDLSIDDIQILVASEETESKGMENKPPLSLPEIKKSKDDNMEMETDILNIDDKCEKEPDPNSAEPIEGNIFPCPHCERSFPLAQLRNLHLKIHLRNRRFPCSKCNKSFFSKYDMERHLLLHSAEKPFKCTGCDKAFYRAVYLSRHLKLHTDIPKHTCDHCDMTFVSKEDMERHVKRHNTKGPFQCKTCNKSFKNKYGLYNHKAVHLSLQPFNCQYCDQSFPDASKLTRHLKFHASNIPYPCKYCKKSYTKWQNYIQHLRSHRKKSYFLCPTCKTRFKTRNKLIRHSRTHLNEQNLTCPLCKETFKNIKILGTHVQDHSKGEAYVCEFCDLIFITAEKLQYHTDLDHTQEMELYHTDDRVQADEMEENSIKDEIDIGEESLQNTVNVLMEGLSDGRKKQIERKIKTEQDIESKADDNVSLSIPSKQRKINANDENFAKTEQQNKQSQQIQSGVVTATRDYNQPTIQSLLKIPEKTSSSTEQTTLLDNVKEDALLLPSSTKTAENQSEVETIKEKVKVQKIKVTKAEAASMVKAGHVKIKDGKIILKRKTSKTIV